VGLSWLSGRLLRHYVCGECGRTSCGAELIGYTSTLIPLVAEAVRASSRYIMSFLEIKGLHVFVTGAAGGIGSAVVDEFLGM
jgi:glycerate kinase